MQSLQCLIGLIFITGVFAKHLTDKLYVYLGGNIDEVGIFGEVSYFADIYYVLLFLPMLIVAGFILRNGYALFIRFLNYLFHVLHLGGKNSDMAEDINDETIFSESEENSAGEQQKITLDSNQESVEENPIQEDKKKSSSKGSWIVLINAIIFLAIVKGCDRCAANVLDGVFNNSYLGFMGYIILFIVFAFFLTFLVSFSKGKKEDSREEDDELK